MDVKDIVAKMGLQDFDYVLFGDGSGTVIGKPCGWACLAFEASSGVVTKHWGGAASGTNNFAELIPYVLALGSIESGLSPSHPKKPKTVAIVSDSELTVRCGNGEYSRLSHRSLWAAIDWFTSHGYFLSWRHIRRNTNPANAECDRVAGHWRRELIGFETSFADCFPENPT